MVISGFFNKTKSNNVLNDICNSQMLSDDIRLVNKTILFSAHRTSLLHLIPENLLVTREHYF